MSLPPLERYRADLAQEGFQPDPAQEAVVREMQFLYDELLSAAQAKRGLLGRFKKRMRAARYVPVRGLYLWGSVGRGKTHLVNGFHESLPFPEKLRIHFHRFMQTIHHELKGLPETPDPLQIVGDRLADQARIICLDEFHVSDIADAMLLGRLIEALTERGVTLVATSNIPPDELYKDGLQRARFLPAIDLIKQHTRVISLDGNEDFRLRALEKAEIYHFPLDQAADRSLRESFSRLGPEELREGATLEIEGRLMQTVRCADGIVWFDFKELCDGPRGTADYIELARCFHTIFVANVPLMGADDNDKAARFVHMIDEFYDRNVNVILSAQAPPNELYYPEGRLAFAFERTQSRLEEMQSREYLARKHLP